jgi:RNA polymerase sigma factor (sigma-70 family)
LRQTVLYPQSAKSDSLSSAVDARQHEREAFAQVYAAHAPHLFRYFWFHTRSRALAEDLVSETFMTALSIFGEYESERAPVDCWLFGIARHALRRHSRQEMQAEHVPQPDGAEEPTPEEQIDLWEALGELVTPEREVVALKFGAGLTHREIAQVMGLREVHVGVVLYRALEKLRTYLSGKEESHAK